MLPVEGALSPLSLTKMIDLRVSPTMNMKRDFKYLKKNKRKDKKF